MIAERQARTRLLDQEGERVKNGLPPTPTKGTAADPFERAFAEESVKGMGKPESDRLERIVRSRLGLEEGEFTDQIAGAAEQVNNLTLQKMKEQKDKGKTVNRAAAEKEALAEVVKRYKKGSKGLLFKKNTLEETSPTSAIPSGAAEALRADPSLRDQFDEKFGEGAADEILSGDGA